MPEPIFIVGLCFPGLEFWALGPKNILVLETFLCNKLVFIFLISFCLQGLKNYKRGRVPWCHFLARKYQNKIIKFSLALWSILNSF